MVRGFALSFLGVIQLIACAPKSTTPSPHTIPSHEYRSPPKESTKKWNPNEKSEPLSLARCQAHFQAAAGNATLKAEILSACIQNFLETGEHRGLSEDRTDCVLSFSSTKKDLALSIGMESDKGGNRNSFFVSDDLISMIEFSQISPTRLNLRVLINKSGQIFGQTLSLSWDSNQGLRAYIYDELNSEPDNAHTQRCLL